MVLLQWQHKTSKIHVTDPLCGMALEPEEVLLEVEINPELIDFTHRLKISKSCYELKLCVGYCELS